MSQFTQKYTLVQFFDDVEEGCEYASSEWPLHSTVVDTFSVDISIDKVIERLAEALGSHPAASSEVGGDTYFGESGQVQVSLLDRTDSLVSLHLNTISVLEGCGLILNDPQFARDGFLPHVTVQGGGRLNKGDKVQFTALSVVDMFPGNDQYKRKVVKTLNIGG